MQTLWSQTIHSEVQILLKTSTIFTVKFTTRRNSSNLEQLNKKYLVILFIELETQLLKNNYFYSINCVKVVKIYFLIFIDLMFKLYFLKYYLKKY